MKYLVSLLHFSASSYCHRGPADWICHKIIHLYFLKSLRSFAYNLKGTKLVGIISSILVNIIISLHNLVRLIALVILDSPIDNAVVIKVIKALRPSDTVVFKLLQKSDTFLNHADHHCNKHMYFGTIFSL